MIEERKNKTNQTGLKSSTKYSTRFHAVESEDVRHGSESFSVGWQRPE
jgi:hypothetical protein